MKGITVENGVKKWADGVIQRGQGPGIRAWLNRRAYPMIIQAQLTRWQTEGASEGEKWIPLNPEYAERKLKKYASFPGGGRKMLIATGRLVQSLTGQSSEGRKLVKENSLEIVSTVPYGGYVNEVRNITVLGEETVDKLVNDLLEYLMG